ncbi:MAG: hypothetical protein GXP40_13300 [Chloroflexi bacterium]|nr:hypothetical protein [Chloroflexota bacterium]
MIKKWLVLSVSVLIVAACGIPAFPPVTETPVTETPVVETPVPAPRVVAAPALTQFDMLDENNGWGLGEGMVLRTEDGGVTWLDVTPDDLFNDPAYAPASFLDASTAWVLIEDVDGPMVGTIYRTTDGGQTWRWRNTPFGRSDIGFLDAENGYALTGLGAGAGSMGVAIWQTADGGGDWNRVFIHQPGLDDSLPFSGIKNGIAFRDPQHGWIGGSIPQDGYFWLYRTQDGGFTWAQQAPSLPEGFENAQVAVEAPLFFDAFEGVLPVRLLGEDMAVAFYLTEDGGETWTVDLPVTMNGRYAVASPRDFWVWDGGAVIMVTDNGGATWEFRSTNFEPGDTLSRLDFVSPSTGWVLTGDGEGRRSLYRTTDGGATWEALIP